MGWNLILKHLREMVMLHNTALVTVLSYLKNFMLNTINFGDFAPNKMDTVFTIAL